MKEEIKRLIQKLKKDNLTIEDIKMINQLFFNFNEQINKVDIILVLASSSIKRIEKAVEIAKKYKKKIIISGGNFLNKDNMYEYEKYYIYCLTHGIEKKDIILETKSHNTLENILYSKEIFENKYKNIVVVSSSQHLLRVKLTIEKKITSKTNFFYVASYATLVPKKDWYIKKEAKKIILGELERIIEYNLI